MTPSPHIRIDRLLVERGLFDSRAKAQAAIEAGLVIADGERGQSRGDHRSRRQHRSEPSASLCLARRRQAGGGARSFRHSIRRPRLPRCRRLDRRLHAGAAASAAPARSTRSMSAAASCMTAVRARPEVVSLEQTDIRTLSPAKLDPPPDLVVIDVSFISLRLVLPPALALAQKPAQLVALIKPQFEAGRAQLKSGIVRDAAVHAAVCDDIAAFVDVARLARRRHHSVADQRRRRQSRISAGRDERLRRYSSAATIRPIITFDRTCHGLATSRDQWSRP